MALLRKKKKGIQERLTELSEARKAQVGILLIYVKKICIYAFLFNNAIDPFLASFDNALRSRHAGIVRACADDIGIVLKQFKHLTDAKFL